MKAKLPRPDMKKLPVIEIFQSIQGEGTMSGYPVTFIRLAGCNLACPWCDTKESWNPKDVEMLTAIQIADRCVYPFVVITGGEPTIHDLKGLTDILSAYGFSTCLETNGTNVIPEDWKFHWITCSPKPPLFQVNCRCDELKYVVDDSFFEELIPTGIADYITLQPESCKQESLKRAIEIVEKSAASRKPYRLGIQLHKHINVK